MSLWHRPSLQILSLLRREFEVDFRGPIRIEAIQKTNIPNAMKWQTHGNLKLCSGEIDASDHFRRRMFDLKSWIKFEKVEFVIGVGVEIFNGSGGNISNKLSQTNGCLFHFSEGFLAGDGDRGFFDDLLMSSLDGTISTKERDIRAILIGQQLNLQMPSIPCHFHDKNRRARDFSHDLSIKTRELFRTINFSNTLSSTSLGSFDHDGISNAIGMRESFFSVVRTGFVIDVISDSDETCFVDDDFIDANTRPVYAGDLSGLGDDGGGNFVAEGSHGGAWRSDEDDSVF